VLGLLRYDLTAGGGEGGRGKDSADAVIVVWAYEAQRLFRDRLVGDETLVKFDNLLMTIIRTDWSGDVAEQLKSKNGSNYNSPFLRFHQKHIELYLLVCGFRSKHL